MVDLENTQVLLKLKGTTEFEEFRGKLLVQHLVSCLLSSSQQIKQREHFHWLA